MHLVVSPAAAAIKRALGVPVAQYFHAEEVGAAATAGRVRRHPRGRRHRCQRLHGEPRASTGAAGANIRIIPNGVDLPPDTTPEAADRPTFLTIARIQERYKGHDVLVRALALVRAKVPQVQWVVLGDGSLRGEIEALARSYGVADSIRFLGSVSDEQRNSWLRRTQLMAMPAGCRPAASPARASGSSTWRPERTASR